MKLNDNIPIIEELTSVKFLQKNVRAFGSI